MPNASSSRIAEALAKARAMGGQPGEPGLESPTGQRMLENAGIAAGGYGLGNVGASLLAAMAQKGVPMMQGLGEAGAIFPKSVAPETLPEIASGAKTGDPHALFAYFDDFGPGGAKRPVYNIFGDPAHPAVQKAGWGSSVPADVLEEFQIPIVGRQAAKAAK